MDSSRLQKARIETQEIQNSDPDSAAQMEVESLRAQLAECKGQLRNKTIELEKST
jgi:tousled-like kinase